MRRGPIVDGSRYRTDEFKADEIKKALGLLDESWISFLETVRQMAECGMTDEQVQEFFRELLLPNSDRTPTRAAIQQYEAIEGCYRSAPGEELASARGTLWGVINAVT